MPRFKLTIEYDGTGFVGWQRQDNGLAVQQVLEEAAKGYCGTEITVFCAGRTDAGVHATGQVAHLDVPRDDTARTVMRALNYHMREHRVSVTEAEAVDDDFHARFSANERRYRYRIVNRPSQLALERGYAWWVPKPLDAEAMHRAAQVLVGRHDFSSFRASLCQANSPVKTLDQLDVTRQGNHIEIIARARSFLHHQVRNMVGTLKLVGTGKWSADDLAAALEARDRSAGGPTAPPEGLYLTGVGYGE